MTSLRNFEVLALEAAVFVLPVAVVFRKALVRQLAARGFWSLRGNAS
jgi:hypothetical protein